VNFVSVHSKSCVDGYEVICISDSGVTYQIWFSRKTGEMSAHSYTHMWDWLYGSLKRETSERTDPA